MSYMSDWVCANLFVSVCVYLFMSCVCVCQCVIVCMTTVEVSAQ